MGDILRLTLLDNLRSLRFGLSLVVVAGFFVANGLVYSWKGDRAVVEEGQVLTAAERVYESIQTPADAVSKDFRILSLPTGTEFVVEAGSDWFPYAFRLSPRTGAWNSFGSSRGTNSWLRRFEIVDWAFIVRYVVSFLCIALAYDAISGERERGTLRLLLANPLPRIHVLLGKVGAHLIAILCAVAVGALLSLLVMGLNGLLTFDADLVMLVVLFLVATAAYAGIFLLLGAGVSAATGRSSTTLVFMVLVWALLVVVIPQSSRLVVMTTMERFGDWSRISELRNETRQALDEAGIALRPIERGRTDDFRLEEQYAARHRMLEREIGAIQDASLRHEIREYERARWVNSLSPSFALQYTLESLTANGIQRFENFAPQAGTYLETLRRFLAQRDESDPDSPKVHFFPVYMSQRPLDHRQIPRFEERRLDRWGSVAVTPWPVVTLALELLLALWFALWAVARMQIAEAADE